MRKIFCIQVIMLVLMICSCLNASKSIGSNNCVADIQYIDKMFEIPLKSAPWYLGGIFKDTEEFIFPEVFAVDSNIIYIKDVGNNRVCKIDWKGSWIGFINMMPKGSYWIKPSYALFTSPGDSKYYDSIPIFNKLLKKVNRPQNNSTAIFHNVPLWSIDQTKILLHVLDNGKSVITYDSTGSVVKEVKIAPQLISIIMKEDTTGGYQHKTSKQLTPPGPSDDIEDFLGKSNKYYIFYSCFNSEKLFLYNDSGQLKKIIDIERYLNSINFKVSGNYEDPGMYLILYGNKIIIKVTGVKSLLFLAIDLEKIK